jgi:shikimate dehydrogenase
LSPRPRWLPDGRTRIIGIVGRPLEHSLSPGLHTSVFQALARNLIYLPLPVSEDRLPALISEAPGLGLLGFNVTTPFKETVARLVRPLDDETARTGVVNTVTVADDGAAGCGTDGPGILAYLRISGFAGVPYGILGFGATARSLTFRGLRDGCPPAVIVTRRGAAVREVLLSWGSETIVVAGWDHLANNSDRGEAAVEPGWPGLWVSTLRPDLPALPAGFWARAGTASVMVDLNYGAGRTVRMEEARMQGWRSSDGLGPLCCQAALSASLWLGEDVPASNYFRALGRTERSLRPGR